MRKLFTFALALFATAAMNAQNVDTSNWNEGDDIAAYLTWGDYDGSWSGENLPTIMATTLHPTWVTGGKALCRQSGMKLTELLP